MKTSKQFRIMTAIITNFQNLESELDMNSIKLFAKNINRLFRTSKNKRELARMILNEVVLSNDEIVSLLRICFKKESELKNE